MKLEVGGGKGDEGGGEGGGANDAPLVGRGVATATVRAGMESLVG